MADALPLIMAHGPLIVVVVPFMLLFLGVGAILPPVLYVRPQPSRSWFRGVVRVVSGVLLNAYGLGVYALAARYGCEEAFDDGGAEEFLLTALIVFLAVELFVLLRRGWKYRR